MGGGASTAVKHKDLGRSQHAIVKLMMPIYYDSEDITHEQHKMAESCWQLILTDKTPEFLEKKGTEGFRYTSCVTFFYDNYYVRLFDIHPMAKDLFKSGMKGQGKFLVMMISLALSEIEKPAQFDKTLLRLTEIHYHRGVKAVEYGIVGDVLFWTLRKVLGDSFYTADIHRIWVKVYCRMLRTIVPAAVAHELRGADPSLVTKREVTGMFSANLPPNTALGTTDDHSSHELASQKAINTHKENSIAAQVRPAAPVV